jgi:hypothetical protein
MVVDLCSIEPRDLNATAKEMIEQRRAGLGQLVQDQNAAGELGEDGEQARPGRRLKNAIGRRDRQRGACGQPERDRRRELLKRLALLGTPRVGRQTASDLRRASAASLPGDPALARIAGPNLRRNRTVAASQAS